MSADTLPSGPPGGDGPDRVPGAAAPALDGVAAAVLARAAVPGRVKTRLAAGIGATAATRVHAALVRHALGVVNAARPASAALWLEGEAPGAAPGDPTGADAAHLLRGWSIRRQPAGDLGARMQAAVAAALATHARVLLIGTDCPARTADDLRAGARALDRHPVVLQPADDGGYVMVGLRGPARPDLLAALFTGIAWGGPDVLARTLQAVAATGHPVGLLRALPDLDTEADLRAALAAGILADDGVPDDR